MPMTKCKYSEFDTYFGEMICRKYDMPCRVCCVSCSAMALADAEQGDNI